jgi:two-component system phosphate regulon sensor histidine kinase PhoR
MSGMLARTLFGTACAALAGLVLGLLLGASYGWGFFCIVLLGFLAHHVRHIVLLRRWLLDGNAEVPAGAGIWDEIFALLYRQRRAEARQRAQLGQALAQAKEVGRALPYGVAILDEEHRIVWCNDSAEDHFEINARADAGQPITNFVRQPEFVGYLAAGDYSRPLQLKTSRADGLTLSVQLIPYGQSQKLLLSRDVTQGIRLETMRRDFVANVSHELRTPLTVLTGFLETVRELKLAPERTRDYINLMTEQGRRMQRIIDDLLVLSTLESAPEPPRDERIDTGALLARARGEAEALSAGHHRIALEAEPGLDLLGSEHELASAFANLATNAVRYTPAGGEVRLVWRASPEGAEFSVVDTGIGIEPEHIPRLTERFYRVDRGRSRESGGTGLGLAIVKHALARHQARLEIESQPGRGSRFTARFPEQRVIATEKTI